MYIHLCKSNASESARSIPANLGFRSGDNAASAPNVQTRRPRHVAPKACAESSINGRPRSRAYPSLAPVGGVA